MSVDCANPGQFTGEGRNEARAMDTPADRLAPSRRRRRQAPASDQKATGPAADMSLDMTPANQ